ncbi:MAG: transglutaminase domain-containing protein, partial [Planctomycetota bacterium]|nr:transglutaminase domain-containing protein [Planctomycetota bacterium]
MVPKPSSPQELTLELSQRPFRSQLQILDDCISGGRDPLLLLEATAELRDHEPLAYLTRQLGKQGALTRDGVGASLAKLLSYIPETGAHRILRGLERATLSDEQRRILVDAVVESTLSMDLSRLALLCLMDRWLKNTAPEAREKLTNDAIRACEDALQNNEWSALTDPVLLRIPGRELIRLADLAKSLNRLDPWLVRLKEFSNRVLEILSLAPKSLSQANAEDILARRVYTDPGHFLVELLQNAEDACASSWDTRISHDEICLWHDGIPFDARDVVGVLSIGQTTKKKDQIGFFGVGFKSVYEVCERPQIYSEFFQFEVADVSIPRQLGGRPEDFPDHGTLIVLPLRNPEDPKRNAEQLYKKALEVPGQTLLTLPHLKSLKISKDGQSRSTEQKNGPRPGTARLVHAEDQSEEVYLLEHDDFPFHKSRESSKANHTPILIAILINEKGEAQAADPELPTIFSYLPTGERSGLRFILHAHFDVPVDRERLDLSSGWNRWALRQAGTLLARLVRRLIAEDQSQEVFEAFLDILPLNEELGHPAYASILAEFAEQTPTLPFLPGADGQALSPEQSMIVSDPNLRRLLAEQALNSAGQHCLKSLSPRSEKVVKALGVKVFELSDLLALITSVSSTLAEGDPSPVPWLGAAELWEAVAEAATAEELRVLAEQPVLLDSHGKLFKPASLSRAKGSMGDFYRGVRPLLAENLNSDSLGPLWESLRVIALGPEELLNDLRIEHWRSLLLDKDLVHDILSYLGHCPLELTSELGQLPLFSNAEGELQSLKTAEDTGQLWLTPAGRLGDFLKKQELKLPLVSTKLQELLGETLYHWGGQSLDVLTFLDVFEESENSWPLETIFEFHQCLNDLRSDLTARMARRIRALPLFPDSKGVLGALEGEDATLLPADSAIHELLPQCRWIHSDVAKLAYLNQLGVIPIDGKTVARALLLDRTDLLDPFQDSDLRAAYRYLSSHPRAILGDEDLEQRLVEAPIWLGQRGERQCLSDLRAWPETETLRLFYESWRPFPLIEREHPSECSTMELVHALRYDTHLARCNSEGFISDLLDSQGFIAEMDRGLLGAAITEACQSLSRKQVLPLTTVAMFRSSSGETLTLDSWSQDAWTGCRIASDTVRQWLLPLGKSLLSNDDQLFWRPLIDALQFNEPTVSELIKVYEAQPEDEQGELAKGLRAILVGRQEELKKPPEGLSFELWKGRLSALRIWPVDDGLKRAVDVIRRSSFGDLRGDILKYWDFQGYIVHEDAEVHAAALDSVMYFKDPGDYLYQQIQLKARIGQPLTTQSDFLSSREAILATMALLSERLSAEDLRKLPLSVDVSQRLVIGPLFKASTDEQELLADHSLLGKLADEVWADACQKIVSGFVERLPVLRFLEALSEQAPKAGPVSEGRFFQTKERRGQFYGWVWNRREEIERDPHARGQLKRCAAFLTPGAFLRAPKDLLFEPDLPELGIDWSVDPEVPEDLVAWLRGQFSPSDALLDRLLPFLLTAHEEAAAAKNGERSAELLLYLARVLRVEDSSSEEIERLTKQYKIHRRIRIQVQGQDRFRKPTQLMFPPIDGLPGLESFWKSAPERAHDRYQQEATRALVLALGARDDLNLEDVQRLLKPGERHEGKESQLGFARCMGRIIARRPKALEELRGSPWIPDRGGQSRRPEDLYWPTPELEALIGFQANLYPHAEFVYTLPAEARAKLPFLGDKDLRIKDLARHLEQEDEAASELVLDWLEDGLKDKRVDVQELRDEFAQLPIFLDAHGERRSAKTLVREDCRGIFGARRAYWPDGPRYPRMTAAMQIPSVGRRALLEYHQELVEEYQRLGAGIFETDPKLTDSYPQFLRELAKVGVSMKGSLLVLTQSFDGLFELTPNDSGVIAFLSPESLAEAAQRAEAPVKIPVLTDDPEDLVKTYLEAHGVGDLTLLWRPEAYPDHLSGDVTGEHSERVELIDSRIQELLKALPDLKRSLDLPKSLWKGSGENGPKSLRVVKSLKRAGTLLGRELDWSCAGDYDEKGRRLILTEDELASLDETPGLLCRAWLTPGAEPGLLRDIVSDFLIDSWSFENLGELLSSYGVALRTTEKKSTPKKTEPAPKPDNEKPSEQSQEAEEEKEDEGTWSKLSRWLWGDKDEEKPQEKPEREAKRPPRKEKPPRRDRQRPPPSNSGSSRNSGAEDDDRDAKEWTPPASHKNWFRPRESVQQQLRDHSQQQLDSERPPSFGFAFAPAQFPVPQLYAPGVIADAFESRGQRWRAGRMPGEWWRGHEQEGFRANFTGRVPRGESTLPLPLYARLGEVDAGSDARLIARPGQLPVLIVTEDRDVKYEVIFDRVPNFQGSEDMPDVPRSLLAPTVPDKDLPNEVLFFLESLRSKRLSPWHASVAARDFIKKNYVYDPAYLEDPSIARWLAQVSRGRSNTHLAALHAGRDNRHLGRGVCYELNVLAVELLRRLGIPAAASTGWTFDRAFVSEPDHLWALALLPTELGPRWWPIDASTTREGRPLHGFQRPAPRWRARKKRQKARLPQEPKWSQEAPQSLELNQQDYRAPLGDFARVLRYLHREMGQKKMDET